MLAKKFALGFGIAIILPMLVHYGVSTFSPAPKYQERYENYSYQKYQDATGEEKIKLDKERDAATKRWQEKEKIFQKHLFFVAVPIGLAAIIIGAVSLIQAIGTGLMFGGIFTLVDGYCWYWSELQDWMRFLSLLAAFVVLLFIGYRKLTK